MYTVLQTASGRTDQGMIQWIMEVDKTWASFDYLRDSSQEYMTLDNKLAIALLAIIPSNLRRKRRRLQESDQALYNYLANGRQVLFHIYHHLRVDPSLANHYSIEDLSEITWLGDKVSQIETFLSNWIEMTEGMRNDLCE